jgi:hypothetical protein
MQAGTRAVALGKVCLQLHIRRVEGTANDGVTGSCVRDHSLNEFVAVGERLDCYGVFTIDSGIYDRPVFSNLAARNIERVGWEADYRLDNPVLPSYNDSDSIVSI